MNECRSEKSAGFVNQRDVLGRVIERVSRYALEQAA